MSEPLLTWTRLENEILDLCVDVYEAGFAEGSGRPGYATDNGYVNTLIREIRRRWEERLETIQSTARAAYHEPKNPSEVPAWLRGIQEAGDV